MAQEVVLSALVERWKKEEGIRTLCSDYGKDIGAYRKYQESSEREDRVEARKLWNSMSDRYWQIFREILVAMIKTLPVSLSFQSKERLFLDCGFLSPGVTPFNEDLPVWLAQDMPDDMFRYLTFTDLWIEKYALLYNREKRSGAGRFGDKLQRYQAQLSGALKRAAFSLKAMLPQIPECPKDKADELVDRLEKNLEPFLERHMRTRYFRELEKKEYNEVVDGANSFHYARKEIESILTRAVKSVEGFEDSQRRKLKGLLDDVVFLGSVTIHIRNEMDRWDKAVERGSAKFGTESDGDRLVQVEEALKVKKEVAAQMAGMARTDTSPLCQQSHQPPLTFEAVSEILNRLVPLDNDMLRVPRVRMYGIPRVVIVPGQGYGTYDWTDNTFMLPLFPSHSAERAVAYSLATFRWDADEDREFKNTYELLKENRGKSIKGLASSFSNDYYLWLTKERFGFRVLPREVRDWFKTKFDSEGVR
ncbi:MULTISPECIES: hypothetical protein [Dethiosulfovibrio]|uniref:Uncharacterized protein n=2 Tax=Dethiosulfovibrio TaxID=47054 RepID=A0ABS9EQW0_9BACT|nr:MULTISPECIES: hypothetical protein [Dethiosulfovibrio]MCF4114159.1 hypothetical protein [Dethiosulfovibrio russensis]MCF4142651.1 hypothetical protein [Dethiosulfovibrio marinus]MCF4145170.1 hypothetical protein [Dethiosulfovibrio acidaminovorans]MEA3284939.1 hypothetical protein [Synergistota bacterium]